MKKILLSALILVLGLTMSVPDMSAQRRRGDKDRTEHNRGNRPGRNNGGQRPGRDNGNSRPMRPGQNNGGNHNNNNNSNRPGNRPGHNNNNNNGNRPGNRPGHNNGNNGNGGNWNNGWNNGNHNNGNRPGHNNGGYDRPGNRPGHDNGYDRPGNRPGNRPGYDNGYNRPGNRPGHNNGYRPNHGFRPEPSRPGNRPGHDPGYGPMRPGVSRPPVWHRPYRPGYAPARPFFRPEPPRYWRAPRYRVNLWSNILGISIGMTINSAIDRLLYDGYTVTGYDGNEIYLTNVPLYNCYWPDATMYYNNGAFAGSRFYYSTYGYDMMRYRQVYDYLNGLYGAPVDMMNTAQGMSVTWFGSDNQFITLDYGPVMTDAGRRYFTTLSIGM